MAGAGTVMAAGSLNITSFMLYMILSIPLHGGPVLFRAFLGIRVLAVKIEPGLPRTSIWRSISRDGRTAAFRSLKQTTRMRRHELLDQFGDEPAELLALKSCLIDFRANETGVRFDSRDFGEVMRNEDP